MGKKQIVNCLPVEQNMFKQPIKMEITPVKYSDIVFEFTSNTKIGKESIIHQKLERRWWVVKDVLKKNDLYGYRCWPSNITPHFL